MKKFLKIFMIAAVLVLCTTVVATAELSADKRELLDYLHVTEKGEDLSVQATRADMAKMVANGMTLDEVSTLVDTSLIIPDVDLYNDAYPYVAYLYRIGALEGHADGGFYPEEPVEAAHAAKLAVKMLRVPAALYRNTYLDTALINKVELKSSGQYMTKEDLAEMIYSVIMNEVFLIEGGRVPYLTNVLNIREIKALVEADENTSIFDKTSVNNGYLKIGGVVYKNNTDKTKLLGRRVRAFYQNGSEGYPELVCISEYGNRTLKINALKLESYDDRVYEYTVEEHDTTARRARLNSGYTVLYNGEFVDAADGFTASHMLPTSGNVTLIDNNSDGLYEIVNIDKYENSKFVSADSNINKIYTLSSDYLYDSENITVYNSDGKEITLSEIKKDSIVSVAENFDKTKIKIIVSDKTISGRLNTVNKDYVIIGDALFYYNNSELVSGTLPGVGSEGTFYLNFENQIIDYKLQNINGWIYAFLCGIKEESFQVIQFGLFTEQGNFTIYNAEEKFSIDGKKQVWTLSGATSAVSDDTGNYKGIVRVKVDGDGNLKAIDTLKPDIVSSDTELMQVPSSGNQQYRKTLGMIGCDAVVDSATKVFIIPDMNDASTMAVSSPDSLSNTSSRAYSIFTTGKNNFVAGAVLLTEDSSVKVSDREQKLTVVEEISSVIDENGDEAYSLVMSNKTGEKFEMMTKDQAVLDGLVTPVEKGDIIKYGYDLDNKITKVELWYDHKTTGVNWKPDGGSSTGTGVEQYRFDGVAYIYDIKDQYLQLQVNNDPAIDDSEVKKYVTVDKASIYAIYEKTGIVEKVSAGELKSFIGNGENYKVIFSSEYGEVFCMYIYR